MKKDCEGMALVGGSIINCLDTRESCKRLGILQRRILPQSTETTGNFPLR